MATTCRCILLILCVVALVAAEPMKIDRAAVAARLAGTPPAHPRLLFTAADEAPLRQRLAADALLLRYHDAILAQAVALIADQPPSWPASGKSKLHVSRACLGRLLRLAYAWRLTGEARFLDRAKTEMLTVAAFPDWNPGHFLDVAEMTTALAIGYDWLHAGLDAASRATIRQAIATKGLGVFKGNRAVTNWNQVCNAGMLLGALAIWEDEPVLAARIVPQAVGDVTIAMAEYAPDGNYPEAPIYWGYGTTYNVLLIAGCTSALGTDFGLSGATGFLASADYYRHMIGPTGQFFNYSDCGASAHLAPLVAWFARRSGDASLLWHERAHVERWLAAPGKGAGDLDRFLPLFPLWCDGLGAPVVPASLRWAGRGATPVAAFRSGWEATAAFVAIKGGTPSTNHGHMDVGGFVMDADGVRWAEELGAQSYGDLEGKGVKIWGMHQDSQRWTVFRYGSSAHNIITVDGRNQSVKGAAPLVAGGGHALVDLSSLYMGQLAAARRGITLRADRAVLVQDEITTGERPATVRWAMLTRGMPTIDGGNAVLEQDGRTLALRVLSPPGVTLRIWPTDPPPNRWDASNKGTRIIGFEVPITAAQQQRLAVVLVPGGGTTDAVVKPLAEW